VSRPSTSWLGEVPRLEQTLTERVSSLSALTTIADAEG
jgi:hypothetical protein